MGKPALKAHALDLDVLNIPVHDLSSLEAVFTEQEVCDAISSLPAEKATRPNGFTAMFYQQCWSIIKTDGMAAVLKLGSLAGQNFLLNQALITLLSKKPEPQGAKDYRPISFLHSFAKLFSKILARRLVPEMAKIIAPNQSTFIATCSIQDNFFLVPHSARMFHQLRKPAFLFKLDIAQAFDSVSWSSLFEILRRKGFGSNWCACLPSCFPQPPPRSC